MRLLMHLMVYTMNNEPQHRPKADVGRLLVCAVQGRNAMPLVLLYFVPCRAACPAPGFPSQYNQGILRHNEGQPPLETRRALLLLLMSVSDIVQSRAAGDPDWVSCRPWMRRLMQDI